MSPDASSSLEATASPRNGRYGGSSFFGAVEGIEAVDRLRTPVAFPNGAHATVLLTFDVEGDYGNGTGDERQEIANYRLMADRLAALGLRATFNIVGRMAQEKGPDFVRWLQDAGSEIASHGYEHEMDRATRNGFSYHGHYGLQDNLDDLRRGIDALERITHQKVRGVRLPYGHFNEHCYDAMERLGLSWTSNLGIDDLLHPENGFGPLPFRVSIGGRVHDLVEIPLDTQTFDWAMWIADENNQSFIDRVNAFMRSRGVKSERTPKGAVKVWHQRIAHAVETQSSFTLLCHPVNLTVRSERWKEDPLRDFLFVIFDQLAELQRAGTVWVPTCSELADFYRARMAL